jgi:hypothetical protein
MLPCALPREDEISPLEKFVDKLELRAVHGLRTSGRELRIAGPKTAAAMLAVDTAPEQVNADAQRTSAHRAALVKRHGRWHGKAP